ncbi:MAG: DUF4962 domain-containing protein [Clostridia bacterium]
MIKLFEQESDLFTVQYLPNNTEIMENPPRFSWLPTNDENGPYDLEISTDKNFENIVYSYTDIMYNFFAPGHTLEPGKYFWRYTLTGATHTFSTVREFELNAGLPETPMPSTKERFVNSDLSHPRLWLGGDKLQEFKTAVKNDPTHCKFDVFLEKTVSKYTGIPMVQEPLEYTPKLEVLRPLPPQYRTQWRKSMADCQDIYCRIRFLAIAGVITDNQGYIDEAKETLLHLASWDYNGTTKRSYHDEASFRVLSGLVWGYDWLYNYLTEDERKTVYDVLVIRAREIITHVFYDSKIQYALFDSHAIRSVSSVLIPCGIALYNECEEAENWVHCAIDYVNVLYSPWGGKDGGWSEGASYWTTGLAFLIDALNLVKSFTGVDIFKRPFFKHTADFPVYCWPHDTYRASFGDQSNLGEKPILKTGFNVRSLAGPTGNQLHQWYFEQIAKRCDFDSNKSYDVRSWNFFFDETFFLATNKAVEAKAPASGRNVKYFSDVGWVSMHCDMADEENHLYFLTKSSKYGSVSHSHGDQNAFLLFAYGDPLLVETGYYVAFWSDMHSYWRRQTASKNCLLIDGKGQYAGYDRDTQLASFGVVEEFLETEKYVYVKENATNAYLENVPETKNFTREIYFVDDSYFVIKDNVELTKELDVSFLLHSIYKPEYSENKYSIRGEHANLDVELLHISSGIADLHLTNEFPECVNPEEYAGLDKQWHYTLKTGKAMKHTLVSYYVPFKKGDVPNFTATLENNIATFVNNGKEFKVTL